MAAEVSRFQACRHRAGWGWGVQQFASERDAGLAGAACEEAVVPDAVEPAQYDVEEGATNEVVGERHDLLQSRL